MRRLPVSLVSLLLLSTLHLRAQQTVEQAQREAAEKANANAAAMSEAETLLDKGDWKGAEEKLAPLAATHPRDARIQFDLGYTQERADETDAAAEAYKRSAEADASFLEPRLALGLLEARRGHDDAARASLEAAVKITTGAAPLRAKALRALARLDATQEPGRARDEMIAAIKLTGEQPGDASLTASLAGSAGDADSAEQAYRRALTQNPDDPDAAAGLASMLLKQKKIAEAEGVVKPALEAHPGNPALTASLATVYAAEGRTADALPLVEGLYKEHPSAATGKLLAHLYMAASQPSNAEALCRRLLAATPDDVSLLDDLGGALVAEQKFPEAQEAFSAAAAHRDRFASPADWGEVEGHLAFAASRNHQPEICLQALAARATVLPNSPATLFLEAISHDALQQKSLAIKSYNAFLAAANGTLPDQEFQAKHRLIALEHER